MVVAEDVLRQNQIKATGQRIAILQVLLTANSPLSAEEVWEKLQEPHPDLVLSTVYRNLNLLSEKRLLNRLQLDNERARFEYAGGDHHHHLVCLGCKQVVELDGCPLHEYETSLAKDHDFNVVSHRLVFFGYCPKCDLKQAGGGN